MTPQDGDRTAAFRLSGDDATATGGTIKELFALVKREKGVAVGVGLVATKGLVALDFDCKTVVLIELRDMPTFEPPVCPLCKKGIPLTNK